MADLILAARLMLAEVADEAAWQAEQLAHAMPDGIPATIALRASQAAQGVEAWLVSGRGGGTL